MKYYTFLTLLIAFIAFVILGCADNDSVPAVKMTAAGNMAPPKPSKRLVIVLEDYSKSTDSIRPSLTQFAYGRAQSVEDNESFFLARFGHDCQELSEQVPSDEATLIKILNDGLSEHDKVLGTDYPGVFAYLAEVAARSNAQSIEVYILGDGANDYAVGAPTRYAAAAKALSKIPKLTRVWCIGWNPNVGAFEETHRAFDSALGDRLRIFRVEEAPK